MDQILQNHKPEFEKSLDVLKSELAALRIGRANPLIVENILVESYGTKTPLKQVASINVPSARTLLVQPWDKSIIKDIEKAIIAANIGINPVNEGTQLRLTVPQLTEESRKELVKSAGEKIEKARIAIRQIRDRIKEVIIKQEKDKEITEDDRYGLIEKLDELVKDYNNQIKDIGDKKEVEIMSL